MSRIELDGVLLPDAVEDVPDVDFQYVERGIGFRPDPFILDFAPERLDVYEVGAVGGQVKNVHVLCLPRIEPRPEGSGVVDFGVVEHEHRGAGGGLGREDN